MKRSSSTDRYNPQFLQELANQLSLRHWQRPCSIPVVWNGRLSKSMGRFLFREEQQKPIPLRIELSKQAASFLDQKTFEAIILHELCHYHLFMLGQPFEDRHPHFEAELARVGAITTQSVRLPQKAYQLVCSQCQRPLGVRKRINTQHYLSSCCNKKIIKQPIMI